MTGIQGSARDVTAHKIREDELTHRALHDPLTGVANRTLFDQRLAAALRAQRRAGAPFAVLAIDLDGFKEVNDAHGHLEGDRALVEVAGRLAANVRQADTVGGSAATSSWCCAATPRPTTRWPGRAADRGPQPPGGGGRRPGRR